MSATTVTRAVEHRSGETRRLIHILATKAAFGAVITVAVQNVLVLPHWLAFAAPVASVLGLQVGS